MLSPVPVAAGGEPEVEANVNPSSTKTSVCLSKTLLCTLTKSEPLRLATTKYKWQEFTNEGIISATGYVPSTATLKVFFYPCQSTATIKVVTGPTGLRNPDSHGWRVDVRRHRH